MLYVTTRNRCEQYTAARTLMGSRAADGGLFIPLSIPRMEGRELRSFTEMSFHDCIAKILNRLFHTNLTRWDLVFDIGKYPVRLEAMSHRIIISETWHNAKWSFEGLIEELRPHVTGEKDGEGECSFWLETGIRIAVIFGVMAEMMRAEIVSEENKIDISVVGGNFSAPVALWIARQMGLPIGNIIICCNENSGVWNLFHHGELRTEVVTVSTKTPKADIAVPDGLEALISLTCGIDETGRFVDAWRSGRMYCPEENYLKKLRCGVEVSVISEDRLLQTIPSVFGTSGYLLSPYTAMAYAGLLDYRARTGESCYGIVFADSSPAGDVCIVAEALKISEEELRVLINRR